MIQTLWDRKGTQWATWGLIRTKKDSFWMGRLKWSHCWSQMVSSWVAVRKLLPLGAKLVSLWMVWNRRVSNRLTGSQLVLFWVAYRKAPPQRAKMVSFWVVWFPCGESGLSWSQMVSFWVAFPKLHLHVAHEFTFWGSIPKQGETALFVNAICLLSMWASINLTGCPMFGHIYAEGENVMVTCLSQNYFPNNIYPNVINVVV